MVVEIKQRREAGTQGSSDSYESVAKSHCLYATPSSIWKHLAETQVFPGSCCSLTFPWQWACRKRRRVSEQWMPFCWVGRHLSGRASILSVDYYWKKLKQVWSSPICDSRVKKILQILAVTTIEVSGWQAAKVNDTHSAYRMNHQRNRYLSNGREM